MSDDFQEHWSAFSVIGTLIQVGRIKQIYLHGLLVAHSMGSLDDCTSRLDCSPDMQSLKYLNSLVLVTSSPGGCQNIAMQKLKN